MNLTLVSSEHAKKVFESTGFEKRNKQTNQPEGNIKIEKPIQVLFEGADLNKYFPISDEEIPGDDLVLELDEIKENFCFLFVGHWLQGGVGEDRKNVGLMIRLFLETFKNKKNKPALVLKTSMVGPSYMDRDEILKRIKMIRDTVNASDLPNVYLLHGELLDEEMNELYNHPKVKAHVSFTKGEGLAVNIVSEESASRGDGKSFRKMPGNYYKPDFKHLVETIKDAYENFEKHKQEALQISERVRRDFSWDKQAKLAYDRLQVIKQENFKEENGKLVYNNKVKPVVSYNFVNKAFVQVEKADEELKVEFWDKKENKLISN